MTTQSLPRGTMRLFQVTYPILRSCLRQNWKGLVTILVLGLALGFIPTLKSELEAALVDRIAEALPTNPNRPTDLGAVLKTPLTRFHSGQSDDVPERMAKLLFQGMTFGPSILAYLVLSLGAFSLVITSESVQAHISKQVFSRLTSAAFRKGLEADPADLPSVTNVSGQYAMAIQQGATNVTATYRYLFELGQHAFQLVTTLILVMTKSALFGGFCLVVVAAQVFISRLQAKRLARRREDLDEKRNKLVGRSDDILAKREIVLAFEQQTSCGEKLEEASSKYAEVDRQLDVSEARYRALSQVVTEVGQVVLLLGALILAIGVSGSAVGSVGEVYFLTSIYARMLGAGSNILSRYDNLKRSEATSRTFLELLAFAPSHRRLSAVAIASDHEWKKREDIRFENVSFSYERDGRRILDNCSFRIPALKTTLLVGPSGCGKTTIARLLLGFWRVSEGKVHIGGGEINHFSSANLRLQMSYVSQGDHILDDAVAENLAWGHSDKPISAEDMLLTLKSVGLPPAIANRSILEVEARNLSIGQQQRLSMARATLDHSEIVIMDEPLAGVDVFTIRDLLPQVRAVLREREHTVLMISHRLAFAAYADHVIVMAEHGRILEEGTPKDLLSKAEGTFTKLHATSVEELKIDRFG